MEAQTQTVFNKTFCFLETAGPVGVVILGAHGDLSRRKLFASLYSLFAAKSVSRNFYLCGLSRTPLSDDEFRRGIGDSLRESGRKIEPQIEKEFLERCHYRTFHVGQEGGSSSLGAFLDGLDERYGTRGNRLFHLALSPVLYEEAVTGLHRAGLLRERGFFRRVIIEKPFGRDLESARALDNRLKACLEESQIYRIDHYLGKETVQNILMFRFANTIFEPLWNREYIDHVQITVAESVGIEHRAEYYQTAGCLRDMFQNHLLQLLALVAMEPPSLFQAGEVREERIKVYRSLRPFEKNTLSQYAVRGQYGPGVIDGREVPGFCKEGKIPCDSKVETYAALKVMVDNRRWKGVPFYLRSGKRLARRLSEIAIEFKRVPHLVFNPLMTEMIPPNRLVFRLQPDENISITFQAKHPGAKICMSDVTMDFNYDAAFQGEVPEAYERLLLDCMLGDQMLFARQDAVETAWEALKPVLEVWEEDKPLDFPNYASGSQGPAEAEELLRRDGRAWRSL